MKAICIILIIFCALAAVYMIFNTVSYWKKSGELPFEQRAKGLQIRMTILPVLLILICIFVVLLKQTS
jgi:hypothetical protein